MASTNYLSVCEKLLDMLHISYVHSFGSRKTPYQHLLNLKKLMIIMVNQLFVMNRIQIQLVVKSVMSKK